MSTVEQNVSVKNREVASEGMIFVVGGEILRKGQDHVPPFVFCRKIAVLTDGNVECEDCITSDVYMHPDRYLLRSYYVNLGNLRFSGKTFVVETVFEDSWMRTTHERAKDEINQLAALPAGVLHEEFAMQTTIALREALAKANEGKSHGSEAVQA